MNTVVYDKAKYHYKAEDFPRGVPESQAFIHTGFFLGWLIEQNLISEQFKEDWASEIERLQNHKLSAPEFFQSIDGVLTSDDLNDTGNQFMKIYFDFQNGHYIHDYENTFSEIDNLYLVKDSQENYEKIKLVIDKRFTDWKQKVHIH